MSTRKVKCYAPFYNVYLRGSTSESRVCCMAKGYHTIQNNSLPETFNNPLAQEIREYMLRDEYHPTCHECKKREDLGLDNDRDMYDVWYRDSSVDLPEPAVTMPEPYWADLRPSNLCNLKCRMCYPDNSTEVAREYEDLGLAVKPELTQRKHWELPVFDSVVNLKLLGGEPTLQTEIEPQLSALAEQEHGLLNITTNASSITQFQRWIPYFKRIARVVFNISVDGYEDTYEYVRTPARWSRFSDTVNYLFNNQLARLHSNISFNFCLQAYNYHTVPQMMLWLEQYVSETTQSRTVQILTNPVDQPWFSVGVIPVAYRRQWFEGLSSVEKKVLERRGELKKWLDHTPFDATQVPQFLQITRQLDSHRGTDFSTVNPTLWRMLQQYDN